MDPNQRKMLEVSYEAFENAGEPWEKFSGSKTGVIVGNMNTDHGIMQMYDSDFTLAHASIGGSTSILSNRVNHVFNLKGPRYANVPHPDSRKTADKESSLTVDTACSSSMYALHLAVSSIRNGDCSAAIVGGGNLILAPEMQIMTVKLGALSPTSTCHTFDSTADGYGRAEGFGALYLKKYSDAKQDGSPIRAIIRGTAINS
jgi:acyl transferase domain-containing protein